MSSQILQGIYVHIVGLLNKNLVFASFFLAKAIQEEYNVEVKLYSF